MVVLNKNVADRTRRVDNTRLLSAIMNVLGNQHSGGIEKLIDRFIDEGLGDIINSWISPLENLPVSESQIRRVFGRDMLGEIAWQARMSQKEVLSEMAFLLPQLVDGLTPTGRIPAGPKLAQRMRRLKRVLVS
jgi:uncharacterized protein YidB (DUF937 family)